MIALKRILVPTNLGEPSRAAVRYGVAFARQFDAKLYVVHVLPAEEFEAVIETERMSETLLQKAAASPQAPQGKELPGEPRPEDVIRNAAREDLAGLLSADEERDTRAEYLLRPAATHGPGQEIVACANELGVQLVIMGKHRQGFVDHLLSGSVTEKVMRQAPCPVLIVHYPEQEFVVED